MHGANKRSASISNDDRSYEVAYLVQSDEPTGPGEIRNAVVAHLSGIGYHYFFNNEDHFEYDIYSYLQNVDAKEISEDGLTWEVTATYSSDVPTLDNPFAEPPEIEFDFQVFERVADRDINGSAIRNSAGDPFNDPIPREESLPILRITRNEPSFPVFGALAMKDSINESTWNLFPPKTVKAAAPRTRSAFSPTSGLYYQTNYEFYINPSGWNYTVLDAGFNQLSISGVRQQILVDGQQTNDPKFLDGSGRVLPPSGEPVYLSFEVYKPKDFSYFNLDNIIT